MRNDNLLKERAGSHLRLGGQLTDVVTLELLAGIVRVNLIVDLRRLLG
jgi:hypothetical protein